MCAFKDWLKMMSARMFTYNTLWVSAHFENLIIERSLELLYERKVNEKPIIKDFQQEEEKKTRCWFWTQAFIKPEAWITFKEISRGFAHEK